MPQVEKRWRESLKESVDSVKLVKPTGSGLALDEFILATLINLNLFINW